MTDKIAIIGFGNIANAIVTPLIDKKLIDYIIKRIDRSYGKIVDFIYKIDEVSLKKKRSINLSTIKEVLGE